MSQRIDDTAPRPLRRDWLPEPAPLEGTPEWRSLVERIITAAGPKLRGGRARDPGIAVSWPAILGAWWKPATALASVAAVLLLVLNPPPAQQEPDPGVLPLSLVAADGAPAALLEGLGIHADPVLALIALLEEAR